MICHDNKCIFVHIPKTGGSSIENVIWGSDWSKRTTEQLWMGAVRPGFNKYQSGGLQHLLAAQIRREVGARVFDSFFKFSFVRNPWSKVVSQFCYIKTREDLLRFMGMTRWTSFRKYLDLIEKIEHVQSCEQWRFLEGDNGQCLVDFVGRFENLQEDFERVAGKLGLGSVNLPHEMKRGGGSYQSFYNSRTRDKVARIYQKDIELFGYTFEPT